MSIETMRQALDALDAYSWEQVNAARAALRTAIEQAEKQEPVAWLTKELMAYYLDMVAEAIEDNSSEALRHKAHWMRVRGEE